VRQSGFTDDRVEKYPNQVRQDITEIQRGYGTLSDVGRKTDLFGMKPMS